MAFIPHKWLVFCAALLCHAIPSFASARNISDNLTVDHFLQQEIAYRFRSEPAFTKLLTYYQVETRFRYSSTLNVTAIGRISYDAIHDLQNLETTNPFQDRFQQSEPREIGDIDPFDAFIKEVYADFFFDRADLRIGKQIVRWGVIEGFRITDELNPLDFNEFILRELTDRYIPLWMLRVDRYFKEITLQFIWIPELKFHKPAPEGSEFEQFQTPPGVEEPGKTLLNTEIGLRASTQVKGFDLAFSYFDGWDDFPTASRTLFGLGENSSGLSPAAVTRHHRIRTFGVSFTKGLGGNLFKGEFSYVTGRAFGTLALNPGDLSTEIPKEVERPQFKYGLGWDTRLPFGIESFFQFSQQLITQHERFIIANRLDSGASVVLRKKLLNDALLLKLLVIYILNNDEALIRPRLVYRWTDHLTHTFGADFFQGDEGNIQQDDFRFIGFFDKNDRVYTEIRYSF